MPAASNHALQAAFSPEPVALGMARAVQQAVGGDTVILFGSRARGDHRPHSDIDLLVITGRDGTAARNRAWNRADRTARAYLREHSPELDFDLVAMTKPQFDYCRRARNHVAAQALRDGVIMNGEKFDAPAPHADRYPPNWPDVKQRVLNARRHLRAMGYLLMDEADEIQEEIGYHAQQAVANALKGWLSALDLDYRNRHNIRSLAARILRDAGEVGTTPGMQLIRLMEYLHDPASDPAEPEDWLTRYAVHYRYQGAGYRMAALDRERFALEIRNAVTASIDRIYEITGTGDADLV